MHSQNIIDTKESMHYKKYLIISEQPRTDQIVAAFKRNMSLFALRTVMRGHLGLPRV